MGDVIFMFYYTSNASEIRRAKTANKTCLELSNEKIGHKITELLINPQPSDHNQSAICKQLGISPVSKLFDTQTFSPSLSNIEAL